MKASSQAAFDHVHQRWEARLAAEAARCQGLGAVVETRLLPGSPSVVLLDLAARYRADLIVVSSLSNVPPVRWLLGSVAERITEQAAVPTLVVRSELPFRAWAAGERPLRVFTALDSAPDNQASLRWAKALNTLHRCEITVTSLVPTSCGSWRRRRGGVRSSGQLTPHGAADRRGPFSDQDRDRSGDATLDALVVRDWGLAGRQLAGLACADEADLIVVGIQRPRGIARLWHHPLSRDILREAPMSVACIPSAAAEMLSVPAIPRLDQPARGPRSRHWHGGEASGRHKGSLRHPPRVTRQQPQIQETTRV